MLCREETKILWNIHKRDQPVWLKPLVVRETDKFSKKFVALGKRRLNWKIFDSNLYPDLR